MLGLSVLLSAPARAAPGHLDRVLATRVLRACIWPGYYAVRHGSEPWLARVDQFVSTIQRDGRLLESAQRHGLESIVARP